MKTIFVLIKSLLISLTLIIIILNIIYIILTVYSTQEEEVTAQEVPHALGMLTGLLLRVSGLVAAVRHAPLLLAIYATFLLLIAVYAQTINFQLILNVFTSFIAIIFIMIICVKRKRQRTGASVDTPTPPQVTQVAATPLEPSAPPPYRLEAPPPPYDSLGAQKY